jgi:hypothetical protein
MSYSSDASARSEDIARTAEELALAARELDDGGASFAPIEEGVRSLVDSLEELAVARIGESETNDAAEALLDQLERTDPAYKAAEAEASSIEEQARARLLHEAIIVEDPRAAVHEAAADTRTLLAAIEELRLENDQLQEALQTRLAIGEAKGLIMARSNCSSDAAFEILRRASQRQNVKLREVAAEIVAQHIASLPPTP